MASVFQCDRCGDIEHTVKVYAFGKVCMSHPVGSDTTAEEKALSVTLDVCASCSRSDITRL